MKLAVVALLGLAACGGDMMNNAALRAHVDDLVAHGQRPPQLDHLTASAELLVPVLGSTELDRAAYGGIRPSGVVFDWVLGGIAPLALLGASFAVSDARARRSMRWAALGLYVATRVGVLVIGNLHVSEYDDYAANVGVGLRWQH
jgi:hypothetical protein